MAVLKKGVIRLMCLTEGDAGGEPDERHLNPSAPSSFFLDTLQELYIKGCLFKNAQARKPRGFFVGIVKARGKKPDLKRRKIYV
jgi:hypothetical protein